MTTTTQPAELPALSDEQIDKMVDAWFAASAENAHDYRARMRAALAASAAKAVPDGFAKELAEFIEYEARDFAAERFEDCAVESGFIDGLKHAAAMLAAAPTPAAQAPESEK